MLERLVTKQRDGKHRDTLHASDYGKPMLDLYFRMIGEPQTNPPQWFEKLKWGAGLGVEKELLQVLKDSGIVPEEYDQDVHGVIECDLDGCLFTGHMDGNTSLDQTGEPIEIKSINNKNAFDIEKYKNNNPRENYVGQLAMYMHMLKQERGHLFVSAVDGLNNFYFECTHIGNGSYKCGNTVVDITKEIARLKNIYTSYVLTKTLPPVDEYIYKYDIDTLSWDSISKDKISKARNNKAVIGDWQILYSSWKDKIIELQNTTPGYTIEELEKIKKYTGGFTSW